MRNYRYLVEEVKWYKTVGIVRAYDKTDKTTSIYIGNTIKDKTTDSIDYIIEYGVKMSIEDFENDVKGVIKW